MRSKSFTAILLTLASATFSNPIHRVPLEARVRRDVHPKNYSISTTTRVSVISSVILTLTVPPASSSSGTRPPNSEVTICLELVDYGGGTPSAVLCSKTASTPHSSGPLTTSSGGYGSGERTSDVPAIIPISESSTFSSGPNTYSAPPSSSSILNGNTRSLAPGTFVTTVVRTATSTRTLSPSLRSSTSHSPSVPVTVTFPLPSAPQAASTTMVYSSPTTRTTVTTIPFSPMSSSSTPSSISYPNVPPVPSHVSIPPPPKSSTPLGSAPTSAPPPLPPPAQQNPAPYFPSISSSSLGSAPKSAPPILLPPAPSQPPKSDKPLGSAPTSAPPPPISVVPIVPSLTQPTGAPISLIPLDS